VEPPAPEEWAVTEKFLETSYTIHVFLSLKAGHFFRVEHRELKHEIKISDIIYFTEKFSMHCRTNIEKGRLQPSEGIFIHIVFPT